MYTGQLINMKKNTRSLTLLLFFLSAVACNSKKNTTPTPENVFAKISYDKAVAYNYDGEFMIQIINERTGHLADKISKEKVLTAEQATRITNTLCDASTYGDDMAACFDPHLGIVFYKLDKPVAYVSICLDCNQLVSSVRIPAAITGFTWEGAKKIMDFEKETGMDGYHHQ